MTTYIRFPIETNPATLAQQVYDYIKVRAPQWNENDAELDVWIIQAVTTLAADLRDLASDVPDDIFRFFGATMISLPPIDASMSTVSSTWVVVDSAGYTIPAGTQVGIRDGAGNFVAFETLLDTIIPPGSTTTGVGAVQLRSIETGAATANLGGAAVLASLLDVLAFVSTVTLTGFTSGGVDAEDDDTYLNRLARTLRLLSTRPILPEDFSIMARSVAGVERAVAIDGYDPATATFGNLRTISVCAIDANGNDVSSVIRTFLFNLLDTNREINFIVQIMVATRSIIDVTFTAHAEPGFVAADVQARAIAAVRDFLNPAKWGSKTNDPQDWTDTTKVHLSELAQVISNVDGLDYWDTLVFGIQGGGLLMADVVIPGPASLAVAGTITGTVV